MRKVEVTPFNQKWQAMFEEERSKLAEIFGTEVLGIHHIGSTSVANLKAKPVIDIMPVVKEIHRIDAFNDKMTLIGYDPKGENGINNRRYFQKGGDKRTHHVHVYQFGNLDIERHLAFRDYLRVHKDDAKRYGALKEELSNRFPYDIHSYISGKEPLVKEIEQKALVWYRNLERRYGF